MADTLLDLYRMVATRAQDWGAIQLNFELTVEQAKAAVERLRKAGVLKIVRVLNDGGEHVSVADGVRDEQTAVAKMKAAGIDPAAPLK